jgi:hypothetical protein
MRKTLLASVLLLAFVGSAQAGIVLTPPVTQPATVEQTLTTDGEIDTGATAPTADGEIPNGAATTFLEVVLNLLALP